MSSIFDAAKYILECSGEMSAMKLQRLCYYSQAWSLVWDDSPLFEEDFQAWESGPVCRELFCKIQEKENLKAEDLPGDVLSDYQRDTIDLVLAHYGNHDAQWLSQLACMEDPWIEARKKGCAYIISKESMAMYYGGL